MNDHASFFSRGSVRRAIATGLAATLAVACGLVLPDSARAEIRLFMEWTDTSSDAPDSLASLGTPDYVGVEGDVVALTLFLGLDDGDWVSAYSVSLEWDNDLGDELDLLSISEVPFLSAGGAILTHFDIGQGFVAESDIESVGTVQNFEAQTLSLGIQGGPDTQRLELATLQFALTSTLETDGDDLRLGFFDSGVDEVLGCPPIDPEQECLPEEAVYAVVGDAVALSPASVSLVPEPGAGALVASVLVGVGVLRRRALRRAV